LVIVRNTAFKKAEKLQEVFKNQRLVFDNSNKFYVQTQLYEASQQFGLNYYFTNRQGAFSRNF
jgi:hypothetical protein